MLIALKQFTNCKSRNKVVANQNYSTVPSDAVCSVRSVFRRYVPCHIPETFYNFAFCYKF